MDMEFHEEFVKLPYNSQRASCLEKHFADLVKESDTGRKSLQPEATAGEAASSTALLHSAASSPFRGQPCTTCVYLHVCLPFHLYF